MPAFRKRANQPTEPRGVDLYIGLLDGSLLTPIKRTTQQLLIPNTVAIHERQIGIMELRPKLSPFFRIGIPKKYGGEGVCAAASAHLHRITAYGSSSVAAHLIGNGLFSYVVEKYGTPKQKKRYLPVIANGSMIASFALTGPEGGSNPASIKSLTYSFRDGRYSLNGSKVYIVNGSIAHNALVIATNPEGKAPTAFIVPSASKNHGNGFTFQPRQMTGWRGACTSDLFFKDVVLSPKKVIGRPGEGLSIALDAINAMRLNIAGQAIGLMQRAIYETCQILTSKGLIDNPSITNKLSKMNDAMEVSQKIWASAYAVADAKGSEIENAISWEFALPPALFVASNTSDINDLMIGKSPESFRVNTYAKFIATEALTMVAKTAIDLHGAAGLEEGAPISVIGTDPSVYRTVAGSNGVLAEWLKKVTQGEIEKPLGTN